MTKNLGKQEIIYLKNLTKLELSEDLTIVLSEEKDKFVTENWREKNGPIKRQIIWLVVLRLNVPVNNFSVMSGRSHRFLGN